MALNDALRLAADGVLGVLFAPACAACGELLDRPTDGPVCAACWAGVACTSPPFFSPHLIERGRAAGLYDGSLRDIIHAFKYDGRRSLASRLAALMHAGGADVLEGVRCVVPVPLHPWRHLRRGFNQSADLARHLPVPVVHALWRVRVTAPQTGLSAAGRRRNVASVFALSPWLAFRARRQRWLDDQVVVLVDDVRTTGATLEACAEVLKSAGVREVRALTIALRQQPARQPILGQEDARHRGESIRLAPGADSSRARGRA